jgi:hypothetical protein
MTTMSDAIRITTDAGWMARRFERYLQRSIQISRVSVERVIRTQARGLLREAFRYTPPMAGRTFFEGKKASESAIRTTVQRATVLRNEGRIARSLNARTTRTPREELQRILEELRQPASALAEKIRSNRRADKNYPDSGPKFNATRQNAKAVQLIFMQTMGITAAGWCAAADALGSVSYPSWIGRWKSANAGQVAFTVTDNVVQFRAVNPNRHRDGATIQRALDNAYDRQASKMRESLISAISRGVLRRQDVFRT